MSTDGATQREGFWAIGRETRASNDDPAPIGALWGSVFADPFAQRIEGRQGDEVISVYCDYEGDHTQPYTVFLGYRVPEDAQVPEGLVRRHVPPGHYVRYMAEGERPASIVEAWQRIWAAGLQRSFVADYEVHPVVESDPVEIWVGVNP